MTCAHVLGLIDAGPFADYPRAHLDAAWEHARQCSTCRLAAEAATAVTRGLAVLAQPAPPPALAGAVFARIAQIDRSHSAPDRAAIPARRAPSGTRDWSAWPTALGGLAAGLAVVLSMPPGGVPIDIASPRVGGLTAGLPVPATTTGALVLAAGLVLYAAGLFAPFGRSRR